MTVYIGAEYIQSPIGNTAEENFAAASRGESGVKPIRNAGYNKEDLFMSAFPDGNGQFSFEKLIGNCLQNVAVSSSVLSSPKTKVILSTTKGDLPNGVLGAMERSFKFLADSGKLANEPTLISTACISGVMAITLAADYIRNGFYDHVLVIGCDKVSEFVSYGFQSLFAVANEPCKPYDLNRTGINLGEGCAAVMLSNQADIYNESPLEFVAGSSANDANHISGPSRTGEGLYRTINKTLQISGFAAEDIDYICAHGTATRFNDDMESIAFSRTGLSTKPLNSLKGYFGHTLGAAGVIETAMSMRSLRNQLLLPSLGYDTPGTTEPLNVLTANTDFQFNSFLKTASGFGGGNASLIIRKLL